MNATKNEQSDTVLQNIPDPETVRERLIQCTREAALLRSYLRLSERAKRQQQSVKREVVNA